MDLKHQYQIWFGIDKQIWQAFVRQLSALLKKLVFYFTKVELFNEKSHTKLALSTKNDNVDRFSSIFSTLNCRFDVIFDIAGGSPSTKNVADCRAADNTNETSFDGNREGGDFGELSSLLRVRRRCSERCSEGVSHQKN